MALGKQRLGKILIPIKLNLSDLRKRSAKGFVSGLQSRVFYDIVEVCHVLSRLGLDTRVAAQKKIPEVEPGLHHPVANVFDSLQTQRSVGRFVEKRSEEHTSELQSPV